MDENEFRRTYDELRELPCLFEKAILSRHCDCSRVARFNLGEREGVRCTSWMALKTCEALLDQLREAARFSIHQSRIRGPLPHGKEIKVQVGGLQGLQAALHPEAPAARVEDVYVLISEAMKVFEALDRLPFQDIVQSIAAFKGRRPRRGRNPPS